jgi:tyrosine-protein phosphatase SIW14
MRSLSFLPLLAAAMVFAGAADTPSGVHNFHTVNDHVYRGAQPTREGVYSLAKLGVRTIIDLRGGNEHSRDEETMVKAAGMHYVHVPLNGLQAPSDQQMATILALLDDSSAWPVFVHCLRGADRTGTVIACYRIAHDHWANEKALREARLDGMSWVERAMQHYILSFQTPTVSATQPPRVAIP